MSEALRPSTTADLAEMVGWARAQGAALDVRGAGSKAALGRPTPDALPLELGAFAGVVDYEPSELVLTARAATPLAEIEALLLDHRQHLAFEPMDCGPLLGHAADAATLGGMIAVNASGPRRIKAGAARDHFLGFEAVSGRGEAFKAGGKVVKNVTGYDLPKLLAGSWGALAAMTEVTLKVLPLPETTATVLVHGLDDAAAALAMSRALGSAADLSAAAHLPAGMAPPGSGLVQAVTALRLEGFAPSVAARRDHLLALLGGLGEMTVLGEADSIGLWAGVRDARVLEGGSAPVWRVSTAPMAGPAVVAALRREAELRAFYDWGGGLVWIATGADAQGVRRALAPHGGHATLVRAPAEVRARAEVFPPLGPVAASLQRRIKIGFDPDGVLSPGRMYADDREPA